MKTKEYFKNEWPIFCLLLIPFIAIAYYWNQIPQLIPIHWNFAGQIDNWENKLYGIFYIPGLNILLYILFNIIPHFDPKRKNYSMFGRSYRIIKISIISLITMLSLIVLFASLGADIDIMYWVIIPIIIVFLIIGNLFGTIRQNYFIGIRIPWTLANEDVWRLTHRFAGRIWVWSSIIMLLLVIFLPSDIIKFIFWIYIGFLIIIPIVYSYLKYQNANVNK